MTRKTIGLDREAYDLLRREKEEEESFSDVIKRLARKRRSFLDFAGAWKDVPKEDLDRIHEFLQKNRKIGRERTANRLRRIR
ncbi:MAG: antitoxin [Methanobacteriota archaeon]|nr:MAG: antitoxin [Euryarchaeota archaeon]